MKAKTIKKAIVVAPVSVLRSWENEANKILRLCIGVKIQVLSSATSKYNRQKRLHQALEAQSPQLVITSFGLVANNPDHFTQHVAGKQVWDYVILDEAVRYYCKVSIQCSTGNVTCFGLGSNEIPIISILILA